MTEVNALPATDADLSKSFLFTHVEEERLNKIQSRAKKISLSAGRTLFLQGDPGDALFIVQSGALEVNVTASSGKKLSLNIMQMGDVIGEIAALDGGPRTASVSSLQDSVLLRVERSTLLDMLKKDPQLSLDLVLLLCGRLRWVSQQVEDLALLDIEGRLASRLLLLTRKFADPAGHLNLSQTELADFLGVTRESTNKVLKGWRSKGIINVSRGSVSIRDHHALSEIAEPQCR